MTRPLTEPYQQIRQQEAPCQAVKGPLTKTRSWQQVLAEAVRILCPGGGHGRWFGRPRSLGHADGGGGLVMVRPARRAAGLHRRARSR
jgi:hypothetical protein